MRRPARPGARGSSWTGAGRAGSVRAVPPFPFLRVRDPREANRELTGWSEFPVRDDERGLPRSRWVASASALRDRCALRSIRAGTPGGWHPVLDPRRRRARARAVAVADRARPGGPARPARLVAAGAVPPAA